MIRKLDKNEKRTSEQIKNAYEIEKELSNRLRTSSKEQRRYLYTSLYDEFFKRVPLTPQLTIKNSIEESKKHLKLQFEFLKIFLHKDITFLEVGPGDCCLSFEISKYVKKVYAVDVSNEITKSIQVPSNFKLLISDGCNIPVPNNIIDLAYSNQLLEHLHPEDAIEQLRNIYKALTPDGIYICITPNRLNGPHDISKYFDKLATGFHLKEYTFKELKNIFIKIGFSKVKGFLRLKKLYINVPISIIILYEIVLEKLPYVIRNLIVRIYVFRQLLEIRMVGYK